MFDFSVASFSRGSWLRSAYNGWHRFEERITVARNMQEQLITWVACGRARARSIWAKFRNFPSRIKWNIRNVHFGNFGQTLEVGHFFRNVGITGNFLFHLMVWNSRNSNRNFYPNESHPTVSVVIVNYIDIHTFQRSAKSLFDLWLFCLGGHIQHKPF